MATSTMFAPHHSSPLARTNSPFKDPRPPPCTPGKTAKLWDEYEKRAVENARKRDRTSKTSQSQRSSTSDSSKAVDTISTRSSFDFKFKRGHAATPSTTLSVCKTCKQPITYTPGICERCKRTIVIASPSGETTPPLSSSTRNFATTDLQQLKASLEQIKMPTSTSPTRGSFCPLPSQFTDPPIRLDSLRPPPPPPPSSATTPLEPSRSRKVSLTDPNEPFLRLQITQPQHAYTPRAHSQSHPISPTFPPTTPPSASHSRASTRPSSLANIASLPYPRTNSVTASELSTLLPYATSPPSLCRSSYATQTPTSAWDDWDSDSEGEKVRLVGWMGRRKAKGKSSGKESKGSMDSFASEGEGAKASREEERLERVRAETAESARARRESAESAVTATAQGEKTMKKRRRPSGFVRAISCGCSQSR